MKNYFEMSARERAEMTIAVLAALQAEGADVVFDVYETGCGVSVEVTKYDIDENNDTQQDLSFELYKLNTEGTDHERRHFSDGTEYETFSCDDDDDFHEDEFHFECEYVNC